MTPTPPDQPLPTPPTPPMPPAGDPGAPSASAAAFTPPPPDPVFAPLPPQYPGVQLPPPTGDSGVVAGTGGTAGSAPAAKPDDKDPRDKTSEVLEFVFLVLGVLLAIVLLRGFVLQFFYIPSGSMERTLACNDRVFVSRVSYLNGGPSTGDVIVFRDWSLGTDPPKNPGFGEWVLRSLGEGVPLLAMGQDHPDLIKRVIGTPGDTVEVRNSRAIVNGKPLDESKYVFVNGPDAHADFGPVKVPEGKYFVMGDHRNDSADSRFPLDGQVDGTPKFVDRDAIVGKATARIWPIRHWGSLDGPPAGAENEPLCHQSF